jgi:hypothetical protein
MNKNKILIFAVIGVLLASSLALAVESAAAMPMDMLRVSSKPVSTSWILLNGVINQSGTADARGQLQTQARTALLQSENTKQLASATAIWTTNTTRAIQSVQTKENFTYLFYEARLVNASVSTLSTGSSTSNYFLNGTWSVATVNSTVTIITNVNGTITRVMRNQDTSVIKAYGELNVTNNWTTFTLNITGVAPLSGSMYHYMQRQMQFNPFKITYDSTSDVVTRSDIGTVAKCYGAMPGWGNYDTRMDFNNNYRVDIADISTVAANMYNTYNKL